MLKSRYFELILYKAYADLRTEAAKTYIGFLWWIIDPIIFMAIFYVVFGLLIERKMENFVPFLLIGLIAWRWFQNSVTHGANTILQNRNLMMQVYLPKIIFPLVTIITDSTKFAFVLTLLLVYLWLSGFPIGMAYLALPVLLVVQLVFIIGCTCLMAALIPFLPDLKILVDHGLQIMFFLSGMFFSGASIPEKYQFYFYLNPMANIIEAYRDIFLHNQWPDWGALSIIIAFSVLAIIFAYRLMMRYDRIYPKVVTQ